MSRLKVPTLKPLTERELQVLVGMADGETNEATGKRLFIGPDTVKTHRARAFAKLGAVNAAHAVSLAYRYGVLRVPPHVAAAHAAAGQKLSHLLDPMTPAPELLEADCG